MGLEMEIPSENLWVQAVENMINLMFTGAVCELMKWAVSMMQGAGLDLPNIRKEMDEEDLLSGSISCEFSMFTSLSRICYLNFLNHTSIYK